ncbi:S-layer homology domain-containing protein [Dysosmobacter sp. Marseille-Q4140]|nr:S-layer homology domain-containing protein [Dysosmobacter sp. Marseille-Q4140]
MFTTHTRAKPRWTALFLALVLALSLTLPAAAAETQPLLPDARTYTGQFADLEGAWCREEAIAVYETDLMNGRTDTRFDIQGSLTYAQITVIAARLQDLLAGGDGDLGPAASGEAWYQPAVDALTASVEESDGEAAAYLLDDLTYLDFRADEPCDRYDFVWYLAAVLPEEALAPINDIDSLPDTSDSDILRFYRAGILTGSDSEGTFNGLDLINRGQAAAMLARIADPAKRMSFTLTVPSYAREILGVEPDTVMLTADGYDITAEAYLCFLALNISAMEAEQAYGYYDTYQEYYEDYWMDEDFDGDFADYLLEVHGIDVSAPVDWDAPDKGGMTPAQKVLQDTQADAEELAALMSRQSQYPLTAQQKTQIEEDLEAYGAPYGFSADFAREILTAAALGENLSVQSHLSSSELSSLLADEGYLYGQYVTIYRGEEGYHASDAEAKAAAEEVRQKLSAHLDDPEYLEFLIWKYSEDYATAPELLPISALSNSNFQTLKALPVGRVSPVLEEENCYMVVIRLDPAEDADLMDTVGSLAAQAQLTQWAEAAKAVLSPACEALDVAAIAQALSE